MTVASLMGCNGHFIYVELRSAEIVCIYVELNAPFPMLSRLQFYISYIM